MSTLTAVNLDVRTLIGYHMSTPYIYSFSILVVRSILVVNKNNNASDAVFETECNKTPKRRNIASIGGSKGGARHARPPGSKFFHFHAVFWQKICKIIAIWELAHPPQENPGSATGKVGQIITQPRSCAV